jgi:ATP-dependent RNA/DNA helicase IGHMBP2
LPFGEVALVTGLSNKAVNAVAKKFADGIRSSIGSHGQQQGIPFIVYGNDDRLGLVARQWTLDAQVERDTRVMVTAQHLCTTGSGPARTSLVLELRKVKEEVRRQLVSRARAVLCTVTTASCDLVGSKALLPAVKKITTAIFDEAGTSPEAALPCLLMLPQLRRIIAIGDREQLAPFTHWNHAGSLTAGAAAGAGAGSVTTGAPRGFFERLVSVLPVGSVPTLTKQYRMHPDSLTQYVSKTSYDGALTTDEVVAEVRRDTDPIGLYWLSYNPGPLGAESAQGTDETSKLNHTEAMLALQLFVHGEAEGYLCTPMQHHAAAGDGSATGPQSVGRSVAVITLHKAQETLLRKVFRDAGIHERGSSPGDDDRRGSFRIMTVDQAQGSEADVVILSLVRSNGRGDIGFASNRRLLNVAISRARERLVVIGDPWAMSTDPRLAELAAASLQLSNVSELPAMAHR